MLYSQPQPDFPFAVPSARQRRSRRVGVIAAVVVAVATVGVAVAVVREVKKSEGPSVSSLRRFLDRVPLPPGAVRTHEDAEGPTFDQQAYLDRTYRLTSATPGAQLRSTLAAAGFRVVGVRGEPEAAVTAPVWSTYATATTGDVNVRPPGSPTGIVELQWAGTRLDLVVTGDNLD